MADRDVGVGPDLADDLGGAVLVRRIDVAVQEMDDDRLRAQRDQAPRRRLDVRLVERADDCAVGIHALPDLAAQLARDQRLEGAGHAVGLRPRAAAELEHVAKAAGRDQAHPRELALEHGVGGGGRAMDDRGELGEGHPRLVEGGEDAEGLVVGRGGDLCQAHLTRRLVDQHEIGEGAADVDACDPVHAHTARYWARTSGLAASSVIVPENRIRPFSMM